MQRQDAVIDLILIAFSLVMIFYIIPTWTAAPEDYGISGGTLPMLCCSVIGVLAAFQLISGMIKGFRLGNGYGMNIGMVAHISKYFIPMFCIIPLWEYIGFWAGSAAILFSLLLITGRRNFILLIPISVILPAAIMIILRYVLHVPTP